MLTLLSVICAFNVFILKGKMIILDLYSELHPVYQNIEGYYGQPWIWCMLQNFGGTLGLYGASNRINSVSFHHVYEMFLCFFLE